MDANSFRDHQRSSDSRASSFTAQPRNKLAIQLRELNRRHSLICSQQHHRRFDTHNGVNIAPVHGYNLPQLLPGPEISQQHRKMQLLSKLHQLNRKAASTPPAFQPFGRRETLEEMKDLYQDRVPISGFHLGTRHLVANCTEKPISTCFSGSKDRYFSNSCIKPAPVSKLTKDYLALAREYKRMEPYRSNNPHSDVLCVRCNSSNESISKVFFPCEHCCVCTSCISGKAWSVCPLCKREIRLILDRTGYEREEYWTCVNQVRLT